VRRVRHGRPVLTLVVTAAGAEPHLLRRTLESARNQRTPLLEIVVVCLDDDAHRTALAAAGEDTRVRILLAPDLPTARREAVRRARGRSLLLAAPGDVYLPGALTSAFDLIDGSSPVVLATAGDPAGRADLQRAPRVAACLRLGRVILATVGEDVLADEDPAGAGSAARALRPGFTLTAHPAYADARTEAPPPHSGRTDPLPGLPVRIARDRAALDALSDLDEARAWAAAGAIAALRPFLEVAEVATDEQWDSLSAHARELLAGAGDRVPEVDVLPRAMARLAADDRRDDLRTLVMSRRFAGDDIPTAVVDGQVHADLGVRLDPADLRLGEHETPLRACVRTIAIHQDRLVLQVLGGIRHVDQTEPPGVTAVLQDADRRVPLDVEVTDDVAVDQWFGESEHDHRAGMLTATIPVDQLPEGSWQIALTWRTHGLERSGIVDELDHHGSAGRTRLLAGDRAVRLRESPGGVRVRVAPDAGEVTEPDVEAVEVGEASLHVTVRGDADHVFLKGEGRHLDAVRQHHGVWAVPLVHDVWGLLERPLPSGSYRLHVERSRARRPAVLAPALLDRVPEETRTATHRLRLLRGHADGLVVRLDPLLAPDEVGPRAQRRLQQAYLSVDEPLDAGLVYFQSFTGQWANDHPLAIQQELVRRRPEVRIRWAVSDSSAHVPEGAEPVLIRSRDWYDVLARAGHVVTNIELDRWFRRRPGQQILQCFHGYPSKSMGLGLWRSRGLLPSHLEQQLDHTSRTWNALLTPDPEMDRYYRSEYAYEGRILSLGYPRNDVLVSSEAHELRVDTRHRLGIAPGQRAVLYAPTWRDDQATNFRAAEAVHHLDVEQAAAALGDDYVLLLRGHRFHAAGDRWGSRVVDVTTYPDVNHLILAADAAVLDYSSMRFDFALTGRPMVFLVPDLEDYDSRTRGFLWDFGETAPGPWVSDTAGVVAELRDVDALARRWAEPIAAFNARYNRLQDGHAAARVVADFFADLPAPV
jgi:CDP-glycerol glycerophosphotransferase (TagB/SpsB family)